MSENYQHNNFGTIDKSKAKNFGVFGIKILWIGKNSQE